MTCKFNSEILKKKLIVIVNPKSGSGKKNILANQLNRYLDQSIYDVEITPTLYRGHATQIAETAIKNGAYAVIVAGGDGTINEVAKALVHTSTALGIIPMGSGNGMSYHLGINRSVRKAIKNINEHTLVKIDTAQANDSFYINVAGLGLDAAVAYRIMNNPNKGFIPYFLASLRESFRFRYFKASVTIDAEVEEGEYAMIVVANGSFYGYNFAITPQALMTDGFLDVLMVNKAMVLRYIPLVFRMLTRSVDKSPLVRYKRAKKVTIHTLDNTYFQMDGEGFLADKTTEFTIQPESIYLIYNAD